MVLMKAMALSSGSSGNSFYVEKGEDAVLIDAGISTKKILARMDALGLDAEKIKAIFITHEHADHIKGADVFARRFNIPIFATKGTINGGFLCSDEALINSIKSDETIGIGKLNVEAFLKSHKAAEPVSYSIRSANKKVSIITDLGFACKGVNDAIADSNFLFLESNHDIEMLENGHYPYFLKNWIKSDSGHLSNRQAGLAVLEYGSGKLKNVVLSHLSEKNNCPKLALKTFKKLTKERMDFKAKVSVSLRSEPTELFKVL
ncbi:MAG: MBL fold metallo-hydrolase [archaeon]|nr:MBL fold metallo-hydrolase [archaeon]